MDAIVYKRTFKDICKPGVDFFGIDIAQVLIDTR